MAIEEELAASVSPAAVTASEPFTFGPGCSAAGGSALKALGSCQWCCVADCVHQILAALDGFSHRIKSLESRFPELEEQMQYLRGEQEELRQGSSQLGSRVDALNDQSLQQAEAVKAQTASLESVSCSLADGLGQLEAQRADLAREVAAHRLEAVTRLEEVVAEVNKRCQRAETEASGFVTQFEVRAGSLDKELEASRSMLAELKNQVSQLDHEPRLAGLEGELAAMPARNREQLEAALTVQGAELKLRVEEKMNSIQHDHAQESEEFKKTAEQGLLAVQQRLEAVSKDIATIRRSSVEDLEFELVKCFGQVQNTLSQITTEARTALAEELAQWRGNLSALQDTCVRSLCESEVQVTCSANMPGQVITTLTAASDLLGEKLAKLGAGSGIRGSPFLRLSGGRVQSPISPGTASTRPPLRRSSSVPTPPAGGGFSTPPPRTLKKKMPPSWT